MEKRRQISEGVDKKINQMKNKVKQKGSRLPKVFRREKDAGKLQKLCSSMKQENTVTERTLEVMGMLLM